MDNVGPGASSVGAARGDVLISEMRVGMLVFTVSKPCLLIMKSAHVKVGTSQGRASYNSSVK